MNTRMAKSRIIRTVLLVSLVFTVCALTAEINEQMANPQARPVASASIPFMPPDIEWERTFGGPVDSASWVIQTSDGGYAMVGTGYRSSRLIKTDSAGNMQFNRTYDFLYGACLVVQTSEGGYVIAGSSGMLVKTDAEGNVQWSQTYSDGWVNSMAQANDGGYVLAGFGKTDSATADDSDFWLAKVNSEGQLQWSKTYGGLGIDEARSVIQTSDGGYAMAGYTESFGLGDRPAHYSNIDLRYNFWLVKTDYAGNLQWSRTFGETGDNEANSLVQTDDGGYVVAGVTRPSGLYGYVTLLIKTDSLGRALWNQTYGVLETVEPGDFANALIRTSDGGFAFAGSTLRKPVHDSSSLFWLVKTDAAGKIQWNQTYAKTPGLVNTWEANCLVETSDGGLAVLGSGKMGGSRNIESNYFYLVKTKPTLPPPSPTPFPSPEPTPSTSPNPAPLLAFPSTTIRDDGSVNPSTASIQRDGDVYTFTGNLKGPLIIERDNITVDGAGHALLGNGTIEELYVRVSGTGINLTGRSHVTIKNLQIEEYLTAINITGSSYITIAGNTINQNWQGISVTGASPKLKISCNTIQANDHYGIWLSDISGSLISGNKISDNSHFGGSAAIIVVDGSNNIIVGNNVETGVDGVYVGHSMNNTIVGNNVANNYMAGPGFHTQGMGMSVSYGSTGNLIYCNNFVNNTVELSEEIDSYNSWDNRTVGNYWSNYRQRYSNATEIDGSGVGDTSYVLASVEGTDLKPLSINNTDHYPLMSPVSTAQVQALQQTLEQAWDLLPPAESPTPSPSTDLQSVSNLIVVTFSALTIIVIVIVAAATLRRRNKQS
jgi:parallel beta-helix repeat protein